VSDDIASTGQALETIQDEPLEIWFEIGRSVLRARTT
jgi:hypothetical protein